MLPIHQLHIRSVWVFCLVFFRHPCATGPPLSNTRELQPCSTPVPSQHWGYGSNWAHSFWDKQLKEGKGMDEISHDMLTAPHYTRYVTGSICFHTIYTPSRWNYVPIIYCYPVIPMILLFPPSFSHCTSYTTALPFASYGWSYRIYIYIRMYIYIHMCVCVLIYLSIYLSIYSFIYPINIPTIPNIKFIRYHKYIYHL